MDGRGGCCIARYGYGGGGGGGGGYDMSKVDKLMLKFRPIAPKPVSGGSTAENGGVCVKSGRGRGRGRGKRAKYVKPRCNNNNNKRKRTLKTDGGEEKTVVTLSLLPETPEPAKEPEKLRNSATSWLSFESSDDSCYTTSRKNKVGGMNMVMQRRPMRVIGSCVTVDCVTDTWVEGDGLGFTDEERKMNLERDTCPGFVSDGVGRVVWTNGAYRNMVGHDEEEEGREMMVWLVMKERAAVAVGMSSYPAFTCRVRVQNSGYGASSVQDWNSLTLPCDVWRMESGGFAWRLDVKAALCLGRYSTTTKAV